MKMQSPALTPRREIVGPVDAANRLDSAILDGVRHRDRDTQGAQAEASGACRVRQIGEFFGVQHITVGRAVRKREQRRER
jgi:hypothetical protein